LEERADTPEMRDMLAKIAEVQRTGLMDLTLTRLSRKMGEPHGTTSPRLRMAENCDWVKLRDNASGAVHNISLTEKGWEIARGKPLWMGGSRCSLRGDVVGIARGKRWGNGG